MKTVKIIILVVFALISFSTFAHSKTSDKEPIIIRAWGLVFGSMESLSKLKEPPVMPEFNFGQADDINTAEIEALKMLPARALPVFNFGTADDLNVFEVEALKTVNASTLPEFQFTSAGDINVEEVEALKEMKTVNLPVFNSGCPEDINIQEIEGLKEIVLN